MIVKNITTSNNRFSSFKEYPKYEFTRDSEGYIIVVGSGVQRMPDDIWIQLKPFLSNGIKVTYNNSPNNPVYIDMDVWRSANVVNFDNFNSLFTPNGDMDGVYMYYFDDSAPSYIGSGSDYTIVCIDYKGNTATWNWSRSVGTLGLRDQTGNITIAVK